MRVFPFAGHTITATGPPAISLASATEAAQNSDNAVDNVKTRTIELSLMAATARKRALL
jgi:hypothetical protein